MTDIVMQKRTSAIAAFCALILFAVHLPTGAALASDVATADADELTVTGSRIPRSDFSTISPISVISREDILASGQSTLEDLLQDLTYTNGGDWGSTNNLAGFGLATVSLRGLGPNRTLILVDGRRMVRAGAEGFVDINSIPLGMIERVEVLRDGASTIYGSDAIAGVINVITRNDVSGLTVDAGYDVTSEGDGAIQKLAANVGSAMGGLNWHVGVEFTSRDAILQQDRGFSACVLSEASGDIACGGSPVTTPSFIVPLADINTIGPHIVDPGTGVTRPFAPTDQFNFAIDSFLTVPQDTTSVYGKATTGLSDTVSLSVSALFHNRESGQQGAPTGTFWGGFVPPTHPDNPFGIDLCATTTGCSGPQPVISVRRASEVGPRTFNQDADSYRVGFSLLGERGNLNWRLSADTARWDETQVDTGKSLRGRVDAMLNPAACAADADCPGLWNPFATDSLTDAQIAWAFTDIRTSIEGELTTLGFDVGAPFNISALSNAAAWHAGIERREQSATVTPDPQAVAGTVWGVPGSTTDGSYSVTELYGEVYLPMSDDLDVEASLRFTDYDYLDADTIFKFAAHYQPVETAGLSIVYAEGFRGPSIDELFLGDQTTAAIYTDPCDNFGANQSNATIIANCQADGLADDVDLSSAQATSLEGGNSVLTPEKSESLTLSLVLNPTEAIALQIDYYQIDITSAISRVGVSTIVNRCYRSTGFSDPFCDFIIGPSDPAIGETPSPTAPDRRNAAGQISGVILSLANFASFETSGLDITFSHERETRWGQLTTRIVASQLSDYTFTAVAGEPPINLSGRFGPDPFHGDISAAFPEWQVNSQVTLASEHWTSSLTARWLSAVDDVRSGMGSLGPRADAVTYFDWQAGFSVSDVKLRLGIRNLTDETPPYVTNYTDVNTLPLTYDLAGRYFYIRAGLNL